MNIEQAKAMLKAYLHGSTGYTGSLRDAIDTVIPIVEKYQKIEEILKDDTYYEEYGNNAEKFIVSAVSEVLEDG